MKKLTHKIIKFNSNDSIFEVVADTFNIGKVHIHMHKYDESKSAGQKVTQAVDVFVSIDEALVLCQDILTGNIPIRVKALKDKGEKYASAWQHLGGISATKLKEKQEYALKAGRKLEDLKPNQKSRPDGKSLSRVFKIVPSSRDSYAFTFQAESGAGEEDSKGLIVPKYGTKPENRVFMPVTPEQAKAFALKLNVCIQAYYNSKYVDKSDKDFYTDLK